MPVTNPPAASATLKVCFVSLQARGAFFPAPGVKVGGAEVQIHRLTVALAREPGHEMHVIVEDAGQPDRERTEGVTLWRLPQPPERRSAVGRAWRRLASGVALWRLVRRIGTDVYVQFSAGAETGLVEHAAHSRGARFVYMMASDLELEPPWSHGGGVSGWLFRRGLQRADIVIAQYDAQRDGIRRLFGRDSVVLPSVGDFPETMPEAGDAVIWVGRCRTLKRPEHFLELARKLPGVQFLMVALPTDEERDLFEKIRREAGELPNLELIPGAPPDRMGAIYPRAGILVSTSDREGVPNVFFEAAAHGLALVSLVVDPEAMFSRHGIGLLAGGDMDRLATLTAGLAGDAEERRALAAKAFDWMKARYSIEHVLPRMKNLLESPAASLG